MAYQALGLGSSANDGTGDDLRTGGDKINDNFVELYTKLGNGSALSNLTFPTGTDTIVGRATTDTLTNKTLTAPTIASITNGGTVTIPSGADTLVARTSTDTLTNKTLTAPKIADGGFIADANGAEQVIFQTTASAVNEIEITNAATGGSAVVSTSTAPIIGSSGETNVDLALLTKGTGITTIRSTGGSNNQGAIKLNCEQNTHGQTLMGQPHSASDSGYFMLPLDGGSARATPNVLLSGAKTIATVQALSGAGAVSLNTLHTQLTTTGAQAQTLANGVNGQIKIITMVADGGDGTLTPATFANGSTITFNDVGDSVLLIYNTTGGWALVSNTGCTIA